MMMMIIATLCTWSLVIEIRIKNHVDCDHKKLFLGGLVT